MKHTPFLTYELDDSLEEADQLLRLMNQVKPEDQEPETFSPESSQVSGS